MNRRSLAVVASAFAVLLTSLGVAGAQGFLSTEAPGPSASEPVFRSAPEWGPAPILYSASAFDFSGFAAGDDALIRGVGSLRYCAGDCFLLDGLTLPSGALITAMEIDAFDGDNSAQVDAWLVECAISGACNPIGVIGTGEAFDAGNVLPFLDLAPAVTVDNLNNTYIVQIEIFGGTENTAFRSFRVFYELQISPAPGTATFPDVSPSFWAFQEIEALAASGITTGFPDGTYRPLEPVTRAQMATFLARALGLHWAN